MRKKNWQNNEKGERERDREEVRGRKEERSTEIKMNYSLNITSKSGKRSHQ